MTILPPHVSEYVAASQRRANSTSEQEARAQILRRHAAELNVLIRRADEAFVLKVDDARNQYAVLLRRLPWDYQKEQRNHELVLHCEEQWGDLGEMIAFRIICERRG